MRWNESSLCHFSRARASRRVLPEKWKGVPEPTLGYQGNPALSEAHPTGAIKMTFGAASWWVVKLDVVDSEPDYFRVSFSRNSKLVPVSASQGPLGGVPRGGGLVLRSVR